MGYRSDVEFYIEGEGTAALYSAYLMECQEDPEFCEWAFNGDKSGEGFWFVPHHDRIRFRYSSIKWYTDAPDIQRIYSIFEKAQKMYDENNDLPLFGEFVRIGEELDDIDEERFGDHDWKLYVSRSIETDMYDGPAEETTSNQGSVE